MRQFEKLKTKADFLRAASGRMIASPFHYRALELMVDLRKRWQITGCDSGMLGAAGLYLTANAKFKSTGEDWSASVGAVIDFLREEHPELYAYEIPGLRTFPRDADLFRELFDLLDYIQDQDYFPPCRVWFEKSQWSAVPTNGTELVKLSELDPPKTATGQALRENARRFRAEIYIKGSQTEKLYGADAERLRERAIRRLTAHKPGWGSLYPDRVEISERVRKSPGFQLWAPYGSVHYSQLRPDQLEWKKEKQKS